MCRIRIFKAMVPLDAYHAEHIGFRDDSDDFIPVIDNRKATNTLVRKKPNSFTYIRIRVHRHNIFRHHLRDGDLFRPPLLRIPESQIVYLHEVLFRDIDIGRQFPARFSQVINNNLTLVVHNILRRLIRYYPGAIANTRAQVPAAPST